MPTVWASVSLMVHGVHVSYVHGGSCMVLFFMFLGRMVFHAEVHAHVHVHAGSC